MLLCHSILPIMKVSSQIFNYFTEVMLAFENIYGNFYIDRLHEKLSYFLYLFSVVPYYLFGLLYDLELSFKLNKCLPCLKKQGMFFLTNLSPISSRTITQISNSDIFFCSDLFIVTRIIYFKTCPIS